MQAIMTTLICIRGRISKFRSEFLCKGDSLAWNTVAGNRDQHVTKYSRYIEISFVGSSTRTTQTKICEGERILVLSSFWIGLLTAMQTISGDTSEFSFPATEMA